MLSPTLTRLCDTMLFSRYPPFQNEGEGIQQRKGCFNCFYDASPCVRGAQSI